MKNRKTICLQGFDYTQPACYFITICAYQFQEFWGQIQHAEIQANEWGTVLLKEWYKTETLRPHVSLDAFVLMPNHLHGIITLHPKEGFRSDFYYPDFFSQVPIEKIQQYGKIVPDSIPFLIKQFKSTVTRQVRELGFSKEAKHWHSGYYERVIRNPKELENVRNYIHNNPVKWENDKNHFKKLLERMDYVV